MAVNPNLAPNLGTKRRRRGRKASSVGALKRRLAPGAVDRARAVGLRRQGRAPASDTRRAAVTRPSGRKTPGPQFSRPTPVAPPTPVATSTTPPTTSVKPPKPPVPAGQPKAYGARRKFGANLPPGLAKRTAGTTSTSTSAVPAGTRAFKPPKPPKPMRSRGRKSY